MQTNGLVIPSLIPWGTLKGKQLEEFLYWLIDSMGGKDLEWRIGGKGDGTADQGRDLECSFYMTGPEGDLHQQKWWIEAKGRTDTVAKRDVNDAVLNAVGRKNVDVLVIATNTQFSNPTRDWVKDWQATNPRPRIQLWEQSTLERLCSKHPTVVARLYSKALSIQGQLELVKTRLWNYAIMSDIPTLNQLWNKRDSLEWDHQALIAVIVSECANGNVGLRPWATVIGHNEMLITLETGLVNLPYLISRGVSVGTRQRPFLSAITYLLLASLDKFGSNCIEKLLVTIWDRFDSKYFSSDLRESILKPILGILVEEIRDVCVSDCSRISTDYLILVEEEVEHYWNRIIINDKKTEEEICKQVLICEIHDKPCKVGYELDVDHSCPINNLSNPEKDISATINLVYDIIRAKKPEHRIE